MRDPEKRRKSHRAWAAAHREIVRRRAAAWDKAHPERALARYLAWAKAHPEKGRANEAKRRAMKLQQRCGCCTNEQFQAIFNSAVLCGHDVDHKIPLRLGGRHCVKNLQPLTELEHVEKTRTDNHVIADARRRSKLLRQWRAA